MMNRNRCFTFGCLLSSIVLASFLSLSCDKDNGGNNWLEQENTVLPKEQRSTILLEEYTGQNCNNCPSAAKELHKMIKEYGDNIIMVALHPRRTGKSSVDLVSTKADVYAEHFEHPLSIPGIMLNRKALFAKKTYSQDRAVWKSNIDRCVNTEKSCDIDLKASWNEEKQKIEVKVMVKPFVTRGGSSSSLSGGGLANKNLKLQLWLLEDVRAPQKLLNGTTKDKFLHKNVFRGPLNGDWGEALELSKTYTKEFAKSANLVNISNAKVVAYVYDDSSKEILQASIVALGTGMQPQVGDEEFEQGGSGVTEPLDQRFSLVFNGVKHYSGSEIKINRKEEVPDEHGVAQTEILFSGLILLGKENTLGKYQVALSKMDHVGVEFGGLTSVCANGSCNVSPDMNQYSFDLNIKKYGITDESFMEVHYRIAVGKKDKKDDYKMKLAVKKERTEIANLTLVFSYTP